MEELLGTGVPQKHSVWDDYVPIITTGRATTIYLTDAIEAPSEYNQTCHIIDNAYKGDEIFLKINNGGGYVDSGFMMINSFKRSKATITGRLSGTVASVSTMLALSCDKLEIDDYVQFMIHNYSGGAQGKGHEMKAQMDFTDAQLNMAFAEIYGGFLTPNEMELVIAGKDIWMGKAELELRLKARKLKDSDALEEIAAARKGK
jgi:ATP-dependent protease ClpP protease subunit